MFLIWNSKTVWKIKMSPIHSLVLTEKCLALQGMGSRCSETAVTPCRSICMCAT
jgi:hypothetical protein